jgi:hypothetical protein
MLEGPDLERVDGEIDVWTIEGWLRGRILILKA